MNKKETTKPVSSHPRSRNRGELLVDKVFTETNWDANTCEEYFEKQ